MSLTAEFAVGQVRGGRFAPLALCDGQADAEDLAAQGRANGSSMVVRRLVEGAWFPVVPLVRPVPVVDRPAPPGPAPQAHCWVPMSDAAWRVQVGGRCRMALGVGGRSCGASSVAAMNRGHASAIPPYLRRDCWWAYCGEHLYGHWVEGGQVLAWSLRPLDGT